MELFYLKDFIFLAILGVCAWFSFRKGWKSGVEAGLDYGMEEALEYLEGLGYIKLEELPNGEIKVHKVKD